jgi:hypothetical protein
MAGLFWIVFATCIIWLALMLTLKNPAFFQNIYIPLSQLKQNYIQYLDSEAIIEWYIVGDTLIVKLDTKIAGKESILKNISV